MSTPDDGIRFTHKPDAGGSTRERRARSRSTTASRRLERTTRSATTTRTQSRGSSTDFLGGNHMAHNGGSNGLRIQPFVGKVVVSRSWRRRMSLHHPARDGKPLSRRPRTRQSLSCRFDLAAKKPSLELLGTTLTSFFGVIDARSLLLAVTSSWARSSSARHQRSGSRTVHLRSRTARRRPFEIAQELLYALVSNSGSRSRSERRERGPMC